MSTRTLVRTFVLNIVDRIVDKIVIMPIDISPNLHTHGDCKNLSLTKNPWATVYAIDIIQSNIPLYITITIEGMHIDKYDDRYLHTHLHTHGDEK